MRYTRYFLLLAPIAGLILLTGAWKNPFASPGHESPPMPEALAQYLVRQSDLQATALLAEAIKDLADFDRPWLRTDISMRCLVPDLRFTAEGQFVRASGNRFRLEVRTRIEDMESTARNETTVLAISDGNDLWQATIGKNQEYRDVERLRLSEIYKSTPSLPKLQTVRERLMAGPAIRGPEQMLRSIQATHIWVHVETGAEQQQLIGIWHPSIRDTLAPAGKPWPAPLPRLCRLTLTGSSKWPSRLEWYGPVVEEGSDKLLTEIEFRMPRRNEPIPEEQCALLFHFHPGEFPVTDTTRAVRAQVDPR